MNTIKFDLVNTQQSMSDDPHGDATVQIIKAHNLHSQDTRIYIQYLLRQQICHIMFK